MIEIDLQTKHHFIEERYYAKQMHLPAGHYAVSHRHTYDHLSQLHTGKAVVTVDGEAKQYDAPAFILVAAHKEHRIDAVTDVVWFCIHETTLTDPDEIDAVAIEKAP